MKNRIIYTAILVAAALCGCNMNQEPYSEVAASGGKVDDIAGLNSLLTGAYNGLHDVMYYEWAVTELRSDNTRSRANASTTQETKLIEQLDQATVTTANEWVENYWNACYATIERTNRVLANLEVAEDETVRGRIEGEAKFLRAHLYFNLVRLWGGVFLVTASTDAEQSRHMQRSPKEDIYALIEGDLEHIVDNELLPLPSEVADGDLGRVTHQAAEALLAKVYMTRYAVGEERYMKAGELLRSAYNAAAGWVDKYADIFSINNEMNPEIIFAVRYLSGNVGLGCPFGTLFGPMNNGNNVIMGSPKHFNYPSDNLIAAFNAGGGDLRKEVTLKESYYNSTTGQTVTSATTARWCDKFLSPITREYDGENDWPVIRLADVMLLLAEWINETSGPGDEAFGLLNRIRERAGLEALTSAEVSSKSMFRNAVRNERRLELACENQRWFDLMRWGTAVDTVNEYLAGEAFYAGYDYTVNPITEWQVMLPIPLSVTNINPNVAQNAGY